MRTVRQSLADCPPKHSDRPPGRGRLSGELADRLVGGLSDLLRRPSGQAADCQAGLHGPSGTTPNNKPKTTQIKRDELSTNWKNTGRTDQRRSVRQGSADCPPFTQKPTETLRRPFGKPRRTVRPLRRSQKQTLRENTSTFRSMDLTNG